MFDDAQRPKTPQDPTGYDSMQGSDVEQPVPSPDVSIGPASQSDFGADFYKLKDRIAEYEDLAQMYKADLMNMQTNYLAVVEQRENEKLVNSKLQKEKAGIADELEACKETLQNVEQQRTDLSDQVIA